MAALRSHWILAISNKPTMLRLKLVNVPSFTTTLFSSVDARTKTIWNKKFFRQNDASILTEEKVNHRTIIYHRYFQYYFVRQVFLFLCTKWLFHSHRREETDIAWKKLFIINKRKATYVNWLLFAALDVVKLIGHRVGKWFFLN